jgi:hypothetical protein
MLNILKSMNLLRVSFELIGQIIRAINTLKKMNLLRVSFELIGQIIDAEHIEKYEFITSII